MESTMCKIDKVFSLYAELSAWYHNIRGENMRDIPIFTTEFGIASLILREIPYKEIAYVRVQSSLQPRILLEECASFCRAAGAERVYADTGGGWSYPIHTQILQLSLPREKLPDTRSQAVPVTDDTLRFFREIYNKKMSRVDNASYMTKQDARQCLDSRTGYFVRKDGADVAIVIASAGKLDALAAIQPGGGREGVLALKQLLAEETIKLEVASTNSRALRLYQSLGFTEDRVLSTWYKIL